MSDEIKYLGEEGLDTLIDETYKEIDKRTLAYSLDDSGKGINILGGFGLDSGKAYTVETLFEAKTTNEFIVEGGTVTLPKNYKEYDQLVFGIGTKGDGFAFGLDYFYLDTKISNKMHFAGYKERWGDLTINDKVVTLNHGQCVGEGADRKFNIVSIYGINYGKIANKKPKLSDGVVLYDSKTFNQTVVLNDSYNNYDFIDIIFGSTGDLSAIPTVRDIPFSTTNKYLNWLKANGHQFQHNGYYRRYSAYTVVNDTTFESYRRGQTGENDGVIPFILTVIGYKFE